jgi:hypothetical protein
LTTLLPCVAPKPLPLICTCVPAGALDGERELIIGLGVLKTTSALLNPANPLTVTGPVVAEDGTVATICVSLQLTTEPLWLLKLMLLCVPFVIPCVCVAPKFDPLIVTWVPGPPLAGDTLLMCGNATVNCTLAGLLMLETVT